MLVIALLGFVTLSDRSQIPSTDEFKHPPSVIILDRTNNYGPRNRAYADLMVESLNRSGKVKATRQFVDSKWSGEAALAKSGIRVAMIHRSAFAKSMTDHHGGTTSKELKRVVRCLVLAEVYVVVFSTSPSFLTGTRNGSYVKAFFSGEAERRKATQMIKFFSLAKAEQRELSASTFFPDGGLDRDLVTLIGSCLPK